MRAYMSTDVDEALRYALRGIEPTRACWALDEATRILVQAEPHEDVTLETIAGRFRDRATYHVDLSDLAGASDAGSALRLSLAAFLEG